MISVNKIKIEVIKRLKQEEIIVNCIRIKGYNKEQGSIDSIKISLEDISSGDNILYKVKLVLDDIEQEFNVGTMERLVEF